MKDCLIIGMALGFVVGAILVQGNKQAQEIVKQGKQAVNKKIAEIKENMKSEKED